MTEMGTIELSDRDNQNMETYQSEFTIVKIVIYPEDKEYSQRHQEEFHIELANPEIAEHHRMHWRGCLRIRVDGHIEFSGPVKVIEMDPLILLSPG